MSARDRNADSGLYFLYVATVGSVCNFSDMAELAGYY